MTPVFPLQRRLSDYARFQFPTGYGVGVSCDRLDCFADTLDVQLQLIKPWLIRTCRGGGLHPRDRRPRHMQNLGVRYPRVDRPRYYRHQRFKLRSQS